MTIFRSEGIRLTVPISADLSRHLTLCAFAADLSRGQLVRRWLAAAVAEAERRHADLAGLSVDKWLEGITHEESIAHQNYERLAYVEDRGTSGDDVRD